MINYSLFENFFYLITEQFVELPENTQFISLIWNNIILFFIKNNYRSIELMSNFFRILQFYPAYHIIKLNNRDKKWPIFVYYNYKFCYSSWFRVVYFL